jgi:hypothetical protein
MAWRAAHAVGAAGAEAVAGVVLAGEGLHHAHVAEQLGRLGGEAGVGVARASLRHADAPPARGHHHREERHHRQRRQPEPQVDREGDGDHPDQGQQLGHQDGEPRHQGVLDPGGVAGEPGDEVAGAVAFVERHSQGEQPVEGGLTQVGADPLGRRARHVAGEVADQGAEGDQRDRAEGGDRGQRPGVEAVERGERSAERPAADGVVDGELERPRPGQVDHGLDQGEGGGHRQRPPVRPQEPAEHRASRHAHAPRSSGFPPGPRTSRSSHARLRNPATSNATSNSDPPPTRRAAASEIASAAGAPCTSAAACAVVVGVACSWPGATAPGAGRSPWPTSPAGSSPPRTVRSASPGPPSRRPPWSPA